MYADILDRMRRTSRIVSRIAEMRRKAAGYVHLLQKTRYIAAVAVVLATIELAVRKAFVRLLGTKSMSPAETGRAPQRDLQDKT
jgi:hypothetical protein